MPRRGVQPWYSLGTRVNAPFFKNLRQKAPEYEHGASTKVNTNPCVLKFSVSPEAIHCILRTPYYACFKMASDKAKWSKYVQLYTGPEIRCEYNIVLCRLDYIGLC